MIKEVKFTCETCEADMIAFNVDTIIEDGELILDWQAVHSTCEHESSREIEASMLPEVARILDDQLRAARGRAEDQAFDEATGN